MIFEAVIHRSPARPHRRRARFWHPKQLSGKCHHCHLDVAATWAVASRSFSTVADMAQRRQMDGLHHTSGVWNQQSCRPAPGRSRDIVLCAFFANRLDSASIASHIRRLQGCKECGLSRARPHSCRGPDGKLLVSLPWPYRHLQASSDTFPTWCLPSTGGRALSSRLQHSRPPRLRLAASAPR